MLTKSSTPPPSFVKPTRHSLCASSELERNVNSFGLAGYFHTNCENYFEKKPHSSSNIYVHTLLFRLYLPLILYLFLIEFWCQIFRGKRVWFWPKRWLLLFLIIFERARDIIWLCAKSGWEKLPAGQIYRRQSGVHLNHSIMIFNDQKSPRSMWQ